MQLVRKAMETSRPEDQLCHDFPSSEDSGSEEEGEGEEDKENEMQVDNNQTGGK